MLPGNTPTPFPAAIFIVLFPQQLAITTFSNYGLHKTFLATTSTNGCWTSTALTPYSCNCNLHDPDQPTMRYPSSVLVLLPCTLFLSTVALPAIVSSDLDVTPDVRSSSNTTQISSLEKRMDPQPGGSAQAGTGQTNNAYEEAKQRGAKYLELLLMRNGERSGSAFGEPVSYVERAESTSLLKPAGGQAAQWTRHEPPGTIRNFAQQYDAVLRATCPTWGVEPNGPHVRGDAPNPLSAAVYQSLVSKQDLCPNLWLTLSRQSRVLQSQYTTSYRELSCV